MSEIQITYRDHIWNYLSYGLNLGINVILLPVILYFLSENEVGLWYVMISIGTLATLFDFGFAPQMARQISYCYTGASEICAEGLSEVNPETDGEYLFSRVIVTSKYIYAIIASVVFILLIFVATFYIEKVARSIFTNRILWAWFFYASACVVNIYYAYFNSFFRGIGKFVILSRTTVISKTVQLILTFVGLYMGYGILAISLGYFFSVITFRVCLRQAYLRFLPRVVRLSYKEKLETFKLLWHNAWREGVVTLSRYLSTQVNTMLCSSYLGLIETAQYALCMQIITIISTFSSIFYNTQQPCLSAAMLNRNLHSIQSIISKSWAVYIVLFIIMAVGVEILGPTLLAVVHSKTALNTTLFVALAVYMFLEGNQSLCASFISTTNKLVYVWPFLIFSVVAVLGSFLLLHFTNIGVWALVLAPFIAQVIYNNWRWPKYIFSMAKLDSFTIYTNILDGLRSRKSYRI